MLSDGEQARRRQEDKRPAVVAVVMVFSAMLADLLTKGGESNTISRCPVPPYLLTPPESYRPCQQVGDSRPRRADAHNGSDCHKEMEGVSCSLSTRTRRHLPKPTNVSGAAVSTAAVIVVVFVGHRCSPRNCPVGRVAEGGAE